MTLDNRIDIPTESLLKFSKGKIRSLKVKARGESDRQKGEAEGVPEGEAFLHSWPSSYRRRGQLKHHEFDAFRRLG